MKNKPIYKISLIAIFTALIFATTYFIAIPMPAGIGYVNLGDAFILLSAWILGPLGCISAGIGAAFADLMLGYALYAPATFIIKIVMSISSYYLFFLLKKFIRLPVNFILSAVCAEFVMILGYFAFESILYSFLTASANVLFNLIQGFCSIVISNIIANILFHNKTVLKYIDNLTQL